jgi:phosphopantothenoylcysteine synthetase/decarboxylase
MTQPAARGVLYAVVCAAPPALTIRALVEQAQLRGWDVCVILTPTAARWLAAELPALQVLTGHPVRSAYKLPGEPDVLPPPDAIIVGPASANTINKWGAGICDNLALGLICEAVGKRLPLVALPFFNSAQAAHPALARNVAELRNAGVTILPGDAGLQLAAAAGPADRPFDWPAALDALDVS